MIDVTMFSDGLTKLFKGAVHEAVDIGDTKDTVIRFNKKSDTCFLKWEN